MSKMNRMILGEISAILATGFVVGFLIALSLY